jgi:hypothetical protein
MCSSPWGRLGLIARIWLCCSGHRDEPQRLEKRTVAREKGVAQARLPASPLRWLQGVKILLRFCHAARETPQLSSGNAEWDQPILRWFTAKLGQAVLNSE